MKKIVQILFVLAPLFLMGQDDTITQEHTIAKGIIDFEKSASITESLRIFASRDYDCIHKDSITDWEVANTKPVHNVCGFNDGRFHSWVYAEPRDVNKSSFMIDSVYRPCGNGGEENQARICRECGMHQARKRLWWYEMRTNKSEYKKLLEKFEGH